MKPPAFSTRTEPVNSAERRGIYSPPRIATDASASPPGIAVEVLAGADEDLDHQENPTQVVQVFRDATRRRWRRVCFGVASALLVLVAFWCAWLRTLRSAGPANAALDVDLPFDLGALARRASAEALRTPPSFLDVRDPLPVGTPPTALAGRFPSRVAWFDPGEENAEHAFEAHAGVLTEVVMGGLHVGDAQGTLAGEVPAGALAIARKYGLRVFERIDDVREGDPHVADVAAIAADRERRGKLARDIAARLEADRADGVVLELSNDGTEAGAAARTAILRELHARLASDKRSVAVAIRAGVEVDELNAYVSIADRVYAHARLDPEDLAAQGPIAPRAWFQETVGRLAVLVPQAKLVVVLPTHGVGWPVRATDLSPAGPGRVVGWSEIVARCRLAGVRPRWDAASGNVMVALAGSNGVASSPIVKAEPEDATGSAFVAWLTDGVTFAEQAAFLRARGEEAIGVEDLGGEDPRVWNVIAADEAARAQVLATIRRSDQWESVGEGVELRVLEEARDGVATVRFAEDGAATETYDALPSNMTIVHRGRPRARSVSLTFDDGPDAEFTPKILDVLRAHSVPATFFLVGSRVERDPELVARIAREGHEIGNHSFSHVDLSSVAERRADLEVRATSLLLQATVGRGTVLFRPPYRADDVPSDMQDLASILAGQRNGVLTVGSSVDPRDWDDTSTADIVGTVVSHVEKDGSGVVLLHDGGGDRGRTVAALDPIITRLMSRGFRFVPMHEVFGTSELDAVNPPVAAHVEQGLGQLGWWAGTWTLRVLRFIALLALVLCLLRVGSLVLCALVDLRVHGRSSNAKAAPPVRRAVSVVIPAYNEAKVIERTVRSVLASEGVDVEVIVLDDGSKDRTADLIARRFLREPRVRLIRLVNGGKAAALNHGFRHASHPIVVALDADTIFLPTTIRELARKFEDARVGAVAGRAVAGNVKSVVARWQAMEYVIGQAVERRAWHLFGLVSVVPGAVGAWRRDAVLYAGGFARDTLAEDSDLTLDLQVRGWRVEYAPDAIALTEAPESVRALFKQRFRWSYGVLQALWKHRRAALRQSSPTGAPACYSHAGRPNGANRAVGLLLLPVVFISHFATPLLAPAADLAAVAALYVGYGGAVWPYALATLVADLALTVFAMRLDGAPRGLAYDWIVNRAVYRWLLFIPLVRAALAALRGGAVGWGKLARKGTVQWKPQEAA
jgi:peptidoglycan/xylan/chitin deacetylase (PgdA/CDA1 family)/GT2 family glycosyltransferase